MNLRLFPSEQGPYSPHPQVFVSSVGTLFLSFDIQLLLGLTSVASSGKPGGSRDI